MPIYEYECLECGKIIQAKHSMREKYEKCTEAIECDGSGKLERGLGGFKFSTDSETNGDSKETGSSTSERVERAIEEFRYERDETKAAFNNKQAVSKDELKRLQGNK